MKKAILALVALLIIVSIPVFAETKEEQFDFRKARWGATREEVVALEKKEPTFENGDFMHYDDVLFGKDCFATYVFRNNKLFCGSYTFAQKHSNDNDYIDDYYILKSYLVEKYGEPINRATEINKKRDYLSNENLFGFYISMGYLEYTSKWSTETTDIHLDLDGENSKINLTISYFSKIDLEYQRLFKDDIDKL